MSPLIIHMKTNNNTKQFFIAITFFLFLAVLAIMNPSGVMEEEQIFIMLGNRDRNIALLTISKIFAFIGSAKFLVPAVVVAIIIGYRKNKRDFTLGLLIASMGTYLINDIIKNLIQRPRPVAYMLATESSFSFPSGHAMVNTAIYLFLAYYVTTYGTNKDRYKFYFAAIISSMLMSWSRVYLGVHYVSDILGGLVGGYICYLGIVGIIRWLRTNPPRFC